MLGHTVRVPIDSVAEVTGGVALLHLSKKVCGCSIWGLFLRHRVATFCAGHC